MKIYDCKVNHLTNPLGYLMNRTVFSWKVKDALGKRQKEARIKVSLDENMNDSIYDTGWLNNLDSLASDIKIELKPKTRYYWTVSVRSDKDLEEATSEIQWFETAKKDEAWIAKWITCDNNEKRHPIFEKEIKLKNKEISKARLYICGLGLYEVYFNNEKIGDEYLTPYSNDYTKWVQYQTYDISDILKKDGKLKVLLGNGWYKGRFGFDKKAIDGYWGKEWKLICELHIYYKDKECEIIGTDESWSVKRSNIIFSNLYDGEIVDDTLTPLKEEKAILCKEPEGKLTERKSLPVKEHETFKPVELIHTPLNEEVFDLGQEFAGIFTLCVHEPKGKKIHIQTGEVLQNENFYNENLRSAKSEYIYISDGNKHILKPHFTYYGYRYVKVDGVSNLKIDDFTGIALYSDMKEVGYLKTGNKLVNRLIENVKWGLKSNFIDVPTDCPQRDERLGWTGDAQVFSPTATYLQDTYAFYAKYLYDMAKEQSHRDGKVVDVIPSPGIDSTACVWGDAACIMPMNLYMFYGDKSILIDQFESMKAWVDYIRRVDGDNHGWRYVFHYGDWLALDNPKQGNETVMGGTDEEFIANLYYAISAGLVAEAASIIGKKQEYEEYQKLSNEQFEIIKKEYYSQTGRCCIKTQTALLLTLKYNLSNNKELIKKQLRKLYEENDGKLKTGFVGTPLMCNILSDNDMEDIAYGLLLNKDYPGWLYEVNLGATTIWERWNSLLPDGTISGIGMNSMNHYSYGSIVEWMFRHGVGINITQNNKGPKMMELIPTPNYEIKNMEGRYDSPCGTYFCKWQLTTYDKIKIEVEIPFGGCGKLKLPFISEETLNDKTNPITSSVKDGICILEAGKYEIEYKMTKSLKKEYSFDSSCRELMNNKEIKKYMDKEDWNIPFQYLDKSINDMYKLFPFDLSKEKLEKFQEFLDDYNAR